MRNAWLLFLPILFFQGNDLSAGKQKTTLPPKVYVSLAFSRLYEEPSGYARTLGFASFGVGLDVKAKEFAWYKVQVMPDDPGTMAYMHESSVLPPAEMKAMLGEDPEEFTKKMEAETAKSGQSNFSEKSGTGYATKGFSEKSGTGYATKGFSERSGVAYATKGFSEKSAVSFATKGFSEKSAVSFATKGFSEKSAAGYATKGFSEKSGSGYATKGFSEKSATGYATKGFSDVEAESMKSDGLKYDLVDKIDNSDILTFTNPTEDLRSFRKEGKLGEYKW